MIRALLALLALGLAAAPALGQRTRHAVPRGAVTGLEMSLEGPRDVRPGETARWLVAAHEIVHGGDYRPAGAVALRVLASYQPSRPVAEAITDAHGRATVEVRVPPELDEGFELVIEAISERRQIQRRFRLQVGRAVGGELTLASTHPRPEPGQEVGLFGEALDPRGEGVADLAIELSAVGPAGVVWGPVRTRTDRFGFYAVTARFPEGVETVEVRARSEIARFTRALQIAPRTSPALRLSAAPRKPAGAPGETTTIDVIVRDALGRPIAGALVQPQGTRGNARRTDAPTTEPSVRTDARGRATLRWTIPPATPEERYAHLRLRAVALGIGEAATTVRVRVTRHRYAIALVPESGALLVGVPSYVYVRVFDERGEPAPSIAVALSGPRLDDARGRTDAEGVARLDVRLAAESSTPDACGGATAVTATVRIGDDRHNRCLAVDPDGTVRVRATPNPSGAVEIALHRRQDVAHYPVLVTVARRERRRIVPVAQQVLAPGVASATLPRPNPGRLLVRARPLVGPGLAEVRGGVAALDPEDAPRLELGTADETPTVRGEGRVLLVALPPRKARGFGDGDEPGGLLLRAARLAAHTPADHAAPAVLRDGVVIDLPAPEDPVAEGILRDPWRQRARYRSGRLALILRALERHVAEAEDLEDVAVAQGGRRRFNRALLDAIAGDPELGAEGARDLAGLPLSIDALEALDPAFTFDRMARRITRARLLRTLVRLRQLVREYRLDYEFARRGSPDQWLAGLRDELERSDLVDGWRRPLRVRRTPQHTRPPLEVVPGWSLVSAGPDGRFGNADDVVDPTARVLPSGSLYAEATDEDGLLRRLRGVALGQATVDELAELFGAVESAGSLPPPTGETSLTPPASPPDSALFDLPEARASAVAVLDDPNGPADLRLPQTPARYAIVALAAGRVRRGLWRHPGSVALVGRWPARLGLGETMTLRPLLLGFGPARDLRLRAEADGAVAEVLSGPQTLGPGDALPVELRLRGARLGRARIRLQVQDGSGRTLWSRTLRPRVVDGAVPRATWAGAAVDDEWDVRFELPPDSQRATGELLLVAPGALSSDPLVRRWRRDGASLQAWAQVVGGRRPDAALLGAARQPSRLPPALARACEVLLWAAVADEAESWEVDFRRAREQLLRAEIDDLRLAAATFAALAPIAGSAPMVGGSEPLESFVEELRERRLWNVLAQAPEQPTVWARAAAALLLADSDDASGHGILQAALSSLQRAPRGGRWVPHEDPREALAATGALLIAAQRAGVTEPVADLRRALASRAWLALSEPGEPAFWLLAASSLGGFGEGPMHVQVDGREVAFDDGVARLSIDPRGRRFRLRVTSEGDAVPLARLRVVHRRPVPAVDGPATLQLRGDAGTVASGAAFEIEVAARRRLTEPVLMVQLPPPALVDGPLRARIARDDDVLAVEETDADGLLRIRLGPLASGARVRVPLPIRWAGSGHTEGLATVVFDAQRPWVTSSLPPRELTVLPDGPVERGPHSPAR